MEKTRAISPHLPSSGYNMEICNKLQFQAVICIVRAEFCKEMATYLVIITQYLITKNPVSYPVPKELHKNVRLHEGRIFENVKTNRAQLLQNKALNHLGSLS